MSQNQKENLHTHNQTNRYRFTPAAVFRKKSAAVQRKSGKRDGTGNAAGIHSDGWGDFERMERRGSADQKGNIMTNEQLAALAQQAENEELVPVLWDKVKNLLYMKAQRAYSSHKNTFKQYLAKYDSC